MMSRPLYKEATSCDTLLQACHAGLQDLSDPEDRSLGPQAPITTVSNQRKKAEVHHCCMVHCMHVIHRDMRSNKSKMLRGHLANQAMVLVSQEAALVAPAYDIDDLDDEWKALLSELDDRLCQVSMYGQCNQRALF